MTYFITLAGLALITQAILSVRTQYRQAHYRDRTMYLKRAAPTLMLGLIGIACTAIWVFYLAQTENVNLDIALPSDRHPLWAYLTLLSGALGSGLLLLSNGRSRTPEYRA